MNNNSKTGIKKLEGREKIQPHMISYKVNEIIEYLEKNFVEWSEKNEIKGEKI